jgi:hypothetical protein
MSLALTLECPARSVNSSPHRRRALAKLAPRLGLSQQSYSVSHKSTRILLTQETFLGT